jgi:2,3-bisphosphoglycerate-independent phosphoglycerate mutase
MQKAFLFFQVSNMVSFSYVLGGGSLPVIFFFIDGVGLGDHADYNPFTTLSLPHLTHILNGQKLTRDLPPFHKPNVRFFPTDATLGVSGVPQSATGQATIWTGRNASKAMGEHKSGFPGPRLRKWLETDNLYKQVSRLGKQATFANAYTSDYFKRRTTERGWISVSTATMLSAGLPLRNLTDLQNGKAVYYDITHIYLKEKKPETCIITPETAATHLLDISSEYDLTVYEYFLTDVAGHRQDHAFTGKVLETVDRFLGALVKGLPKNTTLIVCSDHGNCEDLSQKGHTMNLVPTLLFGTRAHESDYPIRTLEDITPTIIQLLKSD